MHLAALSTPRRNRNEVITPQMMGRGVGRLVDGIGHMATLKHGRLQLCPCVGATRQKVWVLVAALGLACSEAAGPGDCDPTAPGPSIAQARLDSVPPRPTEPRTVDDEWAAIARQVPGGWGGLFLENQIPTIYLVDPSKREEAIEVLIALGIGGGELFDLREARVRQGRWDFAQLYDWRWYAPPVAVAGEPS